MNDFTLTWALSHVSASIQRKSQRVIQMYLLFKHLLYCIKAWIKKDNPKMHIKQHTIKRISICDSEQRFWLGHLSRPTHLPNACREHDASTWKQMSEKEQLYLQVNINYIYLSCLRTKRWGAIFTYMCKYVSEKTKTKKMFFKSRDEPTRI